MKILHSLLCLLNCWHGALYTLQAKNMELYMPLAILMLLISQSKCVTGNAEATLYTMLTSSYIKVRPWTSPTRPVDVTIEFFPYQIMELDGKTQTFHTFGKLIMQWTDPHFTWDPAVYSVQTTELSASTVWKPTLEVYNSATVAWDHNFEGIFPILVSVNGQMTWIVSGEFVTSCDLNMFKFPFDTQTCHIGISNSLHSSVHVNLSRVSPIIDLSFYSHSKEYSLEKASVTNTNLQIIRIGIEFSAVDFSFTLRRKHAYFFLFISLPCIVLSYLSLLVFWLPNESGEKVGLGITVLLSYSIFLLIMSELTPQTSDGMPALTIYLVMLIITSGLTLFCAAISARFYQCDDNQPVPQWIRVYILHGLGKFLLPADADKKLFKKRRRKNNVVDNKDYGATKMTTETTNAEEISEEINPSKFSKPENILSEPIVKELQKLTHKIAKGKDENDIKHEYKLVAKVLDTLFLYFFLIVETLALLCFVIIFPLS